METIHDNAAGFAEIGIQDVDAEHRFQFRILSRMQESVDSGNRDAAIALLQQLYGFSEAHFATEQVFMRLHSYPAYRAHELEHADLLAELGSMISAAIAGEATDLHEWPRTIRRWLASHINTADAAFGKWVRSEEERVAKS